MRSQIASRVLLQKKVALDNLDSFAKEILALLPSSSIVLLNGNLAAGKTTLVASIVKALDVGASLATSPTFALQQCYSNSVFHYDFYRVEFEDLVELGLLEEFEKEGIHLVEWADESLVDLLIRAGFSLFSIGIEFSADGKREYKVEAVDNA